MSGDAAVALLSMLIQVTAFVCGPIILAALLAGVLVGIVQTATQVNEASVSFIMKAIAAVAVLVVLGPALAQHAAAYARDSFEAVAHVVAP